MKIKTLIRKIIDWSFFRPVHIGFYARNHYFKRVMRRLPVSRMVDVLDAGCSDGSYALEISRMFPHFRMTAVDLFDHDFPVGDDHGITFRKQDLLTFDEVETYDFIYCIDVLEHIEGNRAVIGNLSRALRSGGYLYLHIPNDREYKRILPDRFFREFDALIREEHIGEQYRPCELSELLNGLGFEVVVARRTFGFPGRLAWEIDRALFRHFKVRVMLMPILKLLVHLDLVTGHRRGCTLVAARKKPA